MFILIGGVFLVIVVLIVIGLIIIVCELWSLLFVGNIVLFKFCFWWFCNLIVLVGIDVKVNIILLGVMYEIFVGFVVVVKLLFVNL